LSYKIGQLKIQELKDRAKNELGENFDIKDFHHEVLKRGALPLDILEQYIDQWIAQAK
jgi:prolyl oligopeptidase